MKKYILGSEKHGDLTYVASARFYEDKVEIFVVVSNDDGSVDTSQTRTVDLTPSEFAGLVGIAEEVLITKPHFNV